MLTPGAPTHRIDLSQDEPDRWRAVIAAERESAHALFDEAAGVFKAVPKLARWIFGRLYDRKGGLYVDEMKAWAEGVGVDVGTVTMLNCAYELSHLRVPKVFGCTAGVRWIEGVGMVHVRNLDWPLPSMGPATRIFRFTRDGREQFVSIGVPGQVGVLSGMRPGAYSVTINWAPPISFPTFEFGPTFLLRDVLETCATYDEAFERLTKTPMSTSVFFTMCGVERGQACVIERTADNFAVRPMTDGCVTQANHHIAKQFANNNGDIVQVPEGEEEFSLEGSTMRTNSMRESISTEFTSIDEIARAALDVPTVFNKFTVQQMAFRPATGDVSIWRRV